MRRMRFVTWCKKDPEDETPIHYTFYKKEADGKTEVIHMTSEDTVSFSMLERVRQAWVKSITTGEDESGKWWNVVIYED